jgi:hypothetical protein
MEKLIEVNILDLRPTQSGLGMEEVKYKVEKIKKMSPKEFSQYKKSKIVPVILGPKKELYLIDHHHFAYSLHLSGHKHVYIKILADFSNLSLKEFWKKMITKKWVWLESPEGKKIKPNQLPKSLLNLKNDFYRSLSWAVREKNGILPVDKIPFFEFMWGKFYKKYIAEEIIIEDFNAATDMAVVISQSKLAKKIPGFKR